MINDKNGRQLKIDILNVLLLIIIDIVVFNLIANQLIFKHGLNVILKMKSNLGWLYVYISISITIVVEATNIARIDGISASDVLEDGDFGSSIATNGNFTIIGSRDDSGNDAGSAYIYDHNSMQFSQITSNDGESLDYFGASVAILDNIVVVGAYWDDDAGSSSGSAYIFQYNVEMGTWNQSAKFTPSDGDEGDGFGNSVRIENYDNYYRVIVGTFSAEKAYIFRYNSSNGEWNQHAILAAKDGQAFDDFGASVAVDEQFAIVGANYDDDTGYNSGSAYIFRYEDSNDSWNQFAKLTASDCIYNDRFGTSVAIHNNVTIIGAPLHNLNGITEAGSAYIFKYNQTNESWIQVAKLTASDANSDANFGSEVDIYGDLVIVGASSDIGAYIFKYNLMNDTWDEITKIVGINSLSPSESVSIYDNFFAIASSLDDTVYIGNVYDLKNKAITVKVNYNYKTSMEIVRIDINNTDYFSDSIDECNNFNYEIFNGSIISYPLPVNGCYSITFRDCDDSVVNDRTDNHGGYEIEVYNILAGLGGYYFDSETRIICTNDIYNHISFCITPQFCSNNQKLWTHDESDTKMTSYQSMVNSTLTFNQNTTNDIYMTCSGDYSCYNDIFKVCCVFCYFF